MNPFRLAPAIAGALAAFALEYDILKSGMGFKTDARIDAKDTVLPATCKMQRPQSMVIDAR
jgi:hypothetical protein